MSALSGPVHRVSFPLTFWHSAAAGRGAAATVGCRGIRTEYAGRCTTYWGISHDTGGGGVGVVCPSSPPTTPVAARRSAASWFRRLHHAFSRSPARARMAAGQGIRADAPGAGLRGAGLPHAGAAADRRRRRRSGEPAGLRAVAGRRARGVRDRPGRGRSSCSPRPAGTGRPRPPSVSPRSPSSACASARWCRPATRRSGTCPPARWYTGWRHLVWLVVLIGYLFVLRPPRPRRDSPGARRRR